MEEVRGIFLSETKGLTFGNYRLALRPSKEGKTKNLIICMQSRSLEANGQLRYEWSNTLASLSTDSHILFLQDLTNSWYTDQNGWEEAVYYISILQRQAGIEWTVCLGLSMGAYGGLLLGSCGRIDRVIAISAQTCIGKSAAFDWRFQHDWLIVRENAVTDAADVICPDCEYFLLSPCDDLIDVAHLARFQKLVPESVCLVTQGGHHLSEMRANGALGRMLSPFLTNGRMNSSRFAAELPSSIAGLASTFATGAHETAIEQYLVNAARDDRFVSIHIFQKIWRPGQPFPARRNQDLMALHSDQYLTSGWSSAENWGRWAVGVEHTITFQALDFDHISMLFLKIDFIVFGTLGGFQRVSFASLGQAFLDLSVAAETPPMSVLIPILAPHFSIVIHTPDAVSPADLDGRADNRPLSIGVTGMKIVAAWELM